MPIVSANKQSTHVCNATTPSLCLYRAQEVSPPWLGAAAVMARNATSGDWRRAVGAESGVAPPGQQSADDNIIDMTL